MSLIHRKAVLTWRSILIHKDDNKIQVKKENR